MNKEQVAQIFKNYFEKNKAVDYFSLGRVIVELWKENPGMEEVMNEMEKIDGMLVINGL